MTPEEIFKEMPANLNADAAKGMIQTLTGSVSTTYSNPSAPKKAAPKKK